MKFLVLTHQYPKKDNLYRSGFVHQRVCEYIKKGFETEIWVLDNNKTDVSKYIFESVTVFEGNDESFRLYVKENNITHLLVHFLLTSTMKALGKVEKKIPVIIWVHLFEASSWKRRLFDFNNIYFLKFILENINQLRNFKKFNETSNQNLTYIFVSDWIKKIAEKDVNTRFNNVNIIHNYINTDLYKYSHKDIESRKKILSIRTFQSKKYGNDISADAIKILSTKDEFKDMEFVLYGKGKYFNKVKEELKHFPNVKMYNNFLSQEEIANLHKKFGVFLCPTRQDSQGVSMGEAMSSGLVPVTSNNSAIPEFVTNGKNGFLSNNPRELASAILDLYYDPNKFIKMSQMASTDVNKQCGIQSTIDREIEAILNADKIN
ncbi:glycosyltransferase family 4 protein [Gottfriedia sp. S16(2024)]|uniref:glycosyltransferase family 4 protein n=1 Tax=Gottfriedia sp. S16(2024) TaxID=3162883 RepID=UPI003D22E2A1